MGFDEFKSEILNNAKKQAEKTINEAESERKKILENTNEKIKELKSKIDEETKYAIENYKQTIMTDLNSMNKKMSLNLEKELIEKVFELAREKLEKLSEKKRQQHIDKILKSFKEYKNINCSEKDYDYVKKYKPLRNNILGGLILEDENQETRINVSYDELLNEIKKDNISEISKILFK
ncbi:MAG: V-type ATP synthase subunit E family protein [Candidatus Woesearchaeota archaeon]